MLTKNGDKHHLQYESSAYSPKMLFQIYGLLGPSPEKPLDQQR
jgi:hypothetical protein